MCHLSIPFGYRPPVYHVKQEGWEFIGNYDVNELHYEYQDQAARANAAI